MIKNYCSISTVMILALSFISDATGHGYVMTPRSRQWVAAEVSFHLIHFFSYMIEQK